MMVQIVKKRKKGRPSKADLARRNAASDSPASAVVTEKKLRRSDRRRNVRYTFDFDDYIDEDFDDYEDDDEDNERREKKLTLLLNKLQHSGAESPSSETRRVSHAPTASASSSDYGDGSKPLKKRKINGDDEIEDADADNNYIVDYCDDDDDEARVQKVEPKSIPGTPLDHPYRFPLPEKKTLELILDKLQKKDIYGVYAEPVDPEELPDYHEVIKNPMDFATARKKLGNGKYLTLEQFEFHNGFAPISCLAFVKGCPLGAFLKIPIQWRFVSRKTHTPCRSAVNNLQIVIPPSKLVYHVDSIISNDVFLICTNAMQYNAPDTIYYKHALSIQELARRKFQRLRIEFQRSEKELKTEEKATSNSFARKQIKKTISRTLHEPVGSDFSSGATLAMAEDVQIGSSSAQAGGCERPCSIDRPIEGNTSLIDNIIDKGEELLPGKCLLSRPGRKAYVHDENRRATYTISNPLVTASESMFTTFEGESKQLVPVGLHADHSYAWSLARFAATLGSVAWKVASHRIEQAVPAGFKFGRGWVGEYEPLPTPLLMLENCTLKEATVATRFHYTADVRKEGKAFKTPISGKDNHATGSTLEELPLSGPTEARPTITYSTSIQLSVEEEPVRVTSLDGKPPFFCSSRTRHTDHSATYQQRNSQSSNFVEPEKKVPKQVELNRPPLANHRSADVAACRQFSKASEMVETVPLNRNIMQSATSKLPNVNGVGGTLPNGHVVSSGLDSSRIVTSSSSSLPKQRVGTAIYFPHGQEQGPSDPVQLMRMLAEKAQHQHSSLNHSPTDARPLVPPSSSLRKEDTSNAAAAAARTWMSVGAGAFRPAAESTITHNSQLSADSLYNVTREHQPQVSQFRGEFPATGIQFQPDKNKFPLHAFVPQAARMGIEAQFPNQSMVFPQSVTPDLSRFQVQSPWRGLNPKTQPRQKQESLPPDLNIGYQSSGSPVRGVLVDSQQPDLALQL